MATADEKFPRIRDDKFNVAGMFHIPLVQNGRLDRVIGDLYGTPTMYKAFAAANDIRILCSSVVPSESRPRPSTTN